MHARYPTKYNIDGTINEKWHKRKGGKCLTQFQRAQFIAWDGEGMNTGETINGAACHKYVYLANSKGGYIYNEDGLESAACFRLLTDTALEYPKAIHVIFGGSYDINCMFRDLPRGHLERINTKDNDNPVKYRDYALKYTSRKTLFVARYADKSRLFKENSNGAFTPDYTASLTLWDVIGFFQSTFLEAVEKWLGKDYIDYPLILEGKCKRHDFMNTDMDYIKLYNDAELSALVLLMEKLSGALKQLELPIKRWDGAGAIASAMCSKYNVKAALGKLDAQNKYERLTFKPELQSVFQHAYFGGRIEMIRYGYHQSKVYHYDINSAYPSIQRTLPALSKGKFRHKAKFNIHKLNLFSVLKVRWYTPGAYICPFPYRSELQHKILYPVAGINWLWLPEVKAALEVQESSAAYKEWTIELLECYEFVPDKDCYYPYQFIDEYYNKRRALVRELKATGKLCGEEKVIKLGLNSLYGKTAQHVGYNVEHGNIPALHNLAYAGYITSGTRAMIYKAVMSAPESIIAIATDGIFSTAALEVEKSDKKEIGKWDFKEHDSMVMVQAGFYWTLTAGKWSGMSRGFDKVQGEGKTLQEKDWDYQRKMFMQVQRVIRAWRGGYPVVYFPCTRFITLKSALVSDKWFTRWLSWYSMGYDLYQEKKQPRIGRLLRLSPVGTKRIFDGNERAALYKPHKWLIKTLPLENETPGVLSDKYILPWTVSENDEQEIEGIDILIVEREIEESFI